MRMAMAAVLAGVLSPLLVAAQDSGTRLRVMIRTDWEAAQPEPDGWPDLSLAAIRQRADEDRAILDALSHIRRSGLRSVDQTLYDLFQRKVDQRLRQLRLRMYLTPFWVDGRFNGNGLESPWTVAAALQQMNSPVLVADLRLRKLNVFPIYVAQVIALMRAGAAAGLLPSRSIALALSARLRQPLEDLRTPEQSPLYKAFDSLYGSSPGDPQDIRAEALHLIRERVVPAVEAFVRFVDEEYAPACPDLASVSKWPDGEEMFREMARVTTTTGVDPAALHELGEREVKRIREEMLPVVRATGWEGSLDGFLQEARTNPSFYFTSEDDLLAAYRTAEELIVSVAPQVVSRVPVVPVEAMRTAVTMASYSPVYHAIHVDVSRLDLRARYEVIPVMLHEGPPGHALEMQRRQEAERYALPEFAMVNTASSAYVEGWGLYAESLGEDLGLYADPVAKFGELNMELLRAVRLAIDTGVHALGWSREEAERYFVAQTGRAEAMAQAEVERTAWPGEQLAYTVGQERFQAMRARAEGALGEDFDLRRFNDTLLGWGARPFDLLQAKLEDCLAQGCLIPSETQR